MQPTTPVDDALTPTLYAELRRTAAGLLRHERSGHTLEATALVNEAYLRLRSREGLDPADRVAWMASAARHMRQVLVDHARRRRRLKRGGVAATRRHVEPDHLVDLRPPASLLDMADTIRRLADLDFRQAEVVTLRFFGGLTTAETAEVLGISERTVEGDWRFARAWLRRELGRDA